jgi:acyl-coenzyme A synthetase/AMP-(fatty) acid ligase
MSKIRTLAPICLVDGYRAKLKEYPMVVVDSPEHIEHVAAYQAWLEVGGNVMVLNHALDQNTKIELLSKANKKALHVKDKLFFHTTGTTGFPKLVVHGVKQNEYSASSKHLTVNDTDKIYFLNLLPAASIGFWFVAMAPIFKNDGEISFITQKTLVDINKYPNNCAVFPPSVIQAFLANNVTPDLSKFNLVICGASKVEQKHIDALYSWGVPWVRNLYGSTECGVPVLYTEHKVVDEATNAYKFNLAHLKLSSTNELLVSGDSVCDNHEELGSVDGYLPSGDFFTTHGDAVKFDKRLGAEKALSCSKYSLGC